MAPKAPVAATVAATNRHEGATTKLDSLAHGLVDESHKASEVKHDPKAELSHYANLDTVKDQQVPTKPESAIATQTGTVTNPASTAHGAVGDGSF